MGVASAGPSPDVKLRVHGGGRLRPVEVVEVEDGEDVVVLDEGDLLVVEASGELGRFVRMAGRSPRDRRSGQRTGRPTNRKDQLGQHLVDIGRMILRLGPIEGLGARSPLRRHAEIHVADDAGAVERAEEVGGDLVLQFLLADGRWITRCHAHIIPKLAAAVQAARRPRAAGWRMMVRGFHQP